MLKKLSILLVVILSVFALSTCQKTDNTTYYVATSGNDDNQGSLEQPFKSIQQAIGIVNAGDTIIIRAGTYHEQVIISKSGTRNQPITIEGYKNERPVIDGSDLDLSDNDEENGLISIANQSHIIIRNIDVTNLSSKTGAVPSGIRVSGSGENIQLIDVAVSKITTDYQKNNLEEANAHGIAFYGTKNQPLKKIVIKNSEVFDNELGLSEAVVLNGNITDFEVSGNKIHDNDNIGLDFIGFEETAEKNDQARNGVVTNNQIFNNTSKDNPTYYEETSAGGIYVDGGKDILIENNQVYQNDIGIEVASEHQGKTTSNIIVRGNQIYDNQGFAGITFGGYAKDRGYAKKIIIEENDLKNNVVDIIVQFNAQFSSNQIINNELNSNNKIKGDLSNIKQENN